MVGPKPKPVRPLNASKPGFEKPSEIKTAGKKKSKKVETNPASKEKKVGKDVSKVSVKPSEKKKTKTADEAPAPIKDTKVKGAVEETPGYPEPGKIEEAVRAFSKLLKLNSEDGKDLFGSEGRKIRLQVAGIKLPREREQQVIKMKLPHSPHPPIRDICLFVKDLQPGIKVDHEDTVRHFTDLLAEKGVKGVTQIIPLRELKVEYKQFEAKIQLSNKFDLFLADDRIIRLLPQFLGKNFYKCKKIPLQINLRHKDLQGEFSRCLMTTQLPMKHAGASSSVVLGNSEQEVSQLVENTQSVVESLKTKYPGTFKNIRSLHINCGSSSLPLYVSLTSTAELGLVTGNKRSLRPFVTDELSTVVGAEVSVSPFGNVKVKRKADPNWTEKDESLEKMSEDVKANNEEDDESQETPETQESPVKKKKKNDKSESKAKKPAEEESDDDDIEDQELEYMKKVAEEEEEMERKLDSDDKKLHTELEANKKKNDDEDAADSSEEVDEDEEDLDDDAEADNLLSDGDDSGDEEDDIMMRKSLKDIQEEIDEDPPVPKKKSKKAEKVVTKQKGKKGKSSEVASKPVNKKDKKSQKFVEQKKKDKAKSKKK